MSKTSYESALLDPKAVYGHPKAVLEDDSLTAVDKREVLTRWQADAVQMQEAEAEGLEVARIFYLLLPPRHIVNFQVVFPSN